MSHPFSDASAEYHSEARSSRPNGRAGTLDDDLEGVVFDGDEPPAPVPMLIHRLVPKAGLTFLGGQSGAAKSFVAIDMSVALATGTRFFGYDVTERVGVIYVAAEGAATIANRLMAAKKARGVDDKLPIAIVKSVPDLSNKQERARFAKKLKAATARLKAKFGVRVGIVMLDTIAASFTMKDENSAAEINIVCRAAAELGASVGAATLAIAHYGKDASTGLRGSSASRAAGESVIAVLAERDETTGECSNRRLIHPKSRIGKEGAIAAFKLRDIDIGVKSNGEPFGTAYVEVGDASEIEPASDSKAKPKRLSHSAATYLSAAQEAILSAGNQCRPYADGPEVVAVDRERIREIFYPRWPADGDTEKKRMKARCTRFNAGETELCERKMAATLEVNGVQLVWLMQSGERP